MDSLFEKKEKIIKKPVFVGVHMVNGNLLAIHYLRDANPKFVEGLFFLAKRYGNSIFEWAGDEYEMKKNTDLSFTITKKTTEESKGLQAFRKK